MVKAAMVTPMKNKIRYASPSRLLVCLSTSSRAESNACGGRGAQDRQRQTQPSNSKGSQARSHCLPTGDSRTRRCIRSGSGSSQQRANQAAGRHPERPRLQNLWAHLQAIPRLSSLLGCAGESQSWALPIQPSAWLRLPRSLSRHTSQTARRIYGP